MTSLLFVCTANRFRSPLASAFFQKALADFAVAGDWQIGSAGTWTLRGLPVLPEVALIARKYGLDLARHRSRPVTEVLLAAQDLVLVMEAGHREALQHEFPSAAGHIHLLSQVAEERTYDIPDLIDSLESMMEVGGNIHELIRMGRENICSLALRLQAEPPHRN